MTRWLVILDGSTDLDVIEPAGRLLQAHGNRVAIVEAPDPEKLRAINGIASVTDKAPDKASYADLDGGARLFVDAWAMQQDTAKKTRTGEGRDWGDPDFDAP